MTSRGRSVTLALLALAVVLATARLGWWQLDRAAQKEGALRALEAQRRLPALTLSTLPRQVEELPAALYRPVAVDGRWLAEHTVLLDNRPLQGRVGFVVVTPLRLADGAVVAVQRGWVARDAHDLGRAPPFSTPTGIVRVTGTVSGAPQRLLELGGAGTGVIRQNLDLDAYRRELQLPLLPFSILQDDAEPGAADGLTRRWSLPAADVHKHYGYAFQWFALSALVVLLYGWFGIVRPRRRGT